MLTTEKENESLLSKRPTLTFASQILISRSKILATCFPVFSFLSSSALG